MKTADKIKIIENIDKTIKVIDKHCSALQFDVNDCMPTVLPVSLLHLCDVSESLI